MACPCNENTCNGCGCLYPSNSECLVWKGNSISCGDTVIATQGDTLTEIITNLTTLACEGVTVSGNTYIVEGTTNEIDVSSNTVGSETTYTVSLDSAITDQITDNTNNINTLLTCVENGVLEITSSSITVTTTALGTCGNTINLEYTPPSGVTYDGIIYSDSNKVGTSGATGDKILKSFTTNYENYLLAENEEIRIKTNGEILGDGLDVDDVKLELYDANSSTVLYSGIFSGFDKVNKQSWRADWSLTYIDASAGDFLVNINFFANAKQNGTISGFTSNSQEVVNAEVNIPDLTALRIRVIYEHNSTSGSTYNFARQLIVEVRKKI